MGVRKNTKTGRLKIEEEMKTSTDAGKKKNTYLGQQKKLRRRSEIRPTHTIRQETSKKILGKNSKSGGGKIQKSCLTRGGGLTISKHARTVGRGTKWFRKEKKKGRKN